MALFPALFATLHLLYAMRRSLLFLVGGVCLLLLLVCAAMYYGHLFSGLLAVMQKASMAACVGWLAAVHYTAFDSVPAINPLTRDI